MKTCLLAGVLSALAVCAHAQRPPDDDQLGAWYMYFFQKRFQQSPWGIQGDYQLRTWNGTNDLEQLLLRTGVTYRPASNDITFTAGYAFIQTGDFGESRESVNESRLYQEALFPQKLGNRFYLTHRWRFEQRWVDDQDMRTRIRYNLFVNVALNKQVIEKGTLYLALYNEIFVNGQTAIGDGRSVQLFDRNRFYTGLGYGVSKPLRLQVGWMEQTTAAWSKGQVQISAHHFF